MASELTKSLWQQSLIDDLEELKAKKIFTGIPLAVEALDDLIQSFEEEWSKEDSDFAKLKNCPRCGDDRDTNANFCARCGYENGSCKHEETGYHQDGRLFCLKCKKKLHEQTTLQGKCLP